MGILILKNNVINLLGRYEHSWSTIRTIVLITLRKQDQQEQDHVSSEL